MCVFFVRFFFPLKFILLCFFSLRQFMLMPLFLFFFSNKFILIFFSSCCSLLFTSLQPAGAVAPHTKSARCIGLFLRSTLFSPLVCQLILAAFFVLFCSFPWCMAVVVPFLFTIRSPCLSGLSRHFSISVLQLVFSLSQSSHIHKPAKKTNSY